MVAGHLNVRPDFNPRTPRGVRLLGCPGAPRWSDFNPRTPRGVRRKQSGQSHRPSHYFNPRTPRGVRHWATYGWCELQIISIHAPREGCDLDGGGDQFHRLVISIHAPREGCDAIYPHATIVAWGFQSTHPARGATTQYPKIARRKFYFNPRTPRGVRLLIGVYSLGLRSISIHAPREGCDRLPTGLPVIVS